MGPCLPICRKCAALGNSLLCLKLNIILRGITFIAEGRWGEIPGQTLATHLHLQSTPRFAYLSHCTHKTLKSGLFSQTFVYWTLDRDLEICFLSALKTAACDGPAEGPSPSQQCWEQLRAPAKHSDRHCSASATAWAQVTMKQQNVPL